MLVKSNKLNIVRNFLGSIFILTYIFVAPYSALAASLASFQSGSWGDSATWEGETDYSTFPVLVSGTYDYLRTVANGGKVEDDNGYDIIFTSDDTCTTQLNHEIESYDPLTGEIHAWVTIPTLNVDTDTTIYICYGNALISTSQEHVTDVWDANYKGVWHLGANSGPSLNTNDSTNNGYDLANNNGVSSLAGKIGGGTGKFNGFNQYLNNNSLSIAADSDITVSFWGNQATGDVQVSSSFNIGSSTYPNRIQSHSPWSDQYLYWDYGNMGTNTNFASHLDGWAYITLSYNSLSNKLSIFLNGVLANFATGTATPVLDQTGIEIGRWTGAGYHKGMIDEFRVSNYARSASWNKTEYNNQSDPSTFYNIGSEVGGGSPYSYSRALTIDHTKVENITVTPNSYDDITIASGTTVTTPPETVYMVNDLNIESGGTLILGDNSRIVYYRSFTNNGILTEGSGSVEKVLTPSTSSAPTDTSPSFDIPCTTDTTVELVEGDTVLASGTCVDSTISLTSDTLDVGLHNISAREVDGDVVRKGTTIVKVRTADVNIFNDAQKFIVIGDNDLASFTYFDNNWEDLHFVRCLDVTCATRNDTLIVSNPNRVDEPILVIAPDGFVRILYMTFDDPNELHYVVCENDDCTLKTDTLVSAGGELLWSVGLTIGADGFGRFVYEDYDAGVLYFAQCTNIQCSTKNITEISSADSSYEEVTIVMAPDGFARFAYNEWSNDILHYVVCENDDCSDNVDTVIDSTLTTGYYVDLVLGSDGFGRVLYSDMNGEGVVFVQCTDIYCLTKISEILYSPGSQVSIAMGSNNLPRIAYYVSRVNDVIYNDLHYVECLNASCSSRNTTTVDEDGGYPVSLALDSHDNASILYGNYKNLYLATFKSTAVTITPVTKKINGSSSSSSYSSSSNNPYITPQVKPVLPEDTTPPADCLPWYNFSPSTGKSCANVKIPTITTPPTPNTPSCTVTVTLKQGNKGTQVKCLQTLLNINSDGIFGPKTKASVILFQKSHGLTPDGVFGPKTAALMTP